MATTTLTTGLKTRRLEVRASERQAEIIAQAADATERTMTDFILGSAVREAERVLADRTWFAGSVEAYERFLDLLDEPLTETTKLERLWARPTPFGQPLNQTNP
ncbi:MAG: DUF1778 domain-containing protein [Bifidobacteriaceae bacterium]|jgi:uncharacterized protein (DUF1778 family)|nr:DUF1778 domain-containing protein [Bifidobacteriaceae bacterium]